LALPWLDAEEVNPVSARQRANSSNEGFKEE
jgi:hypothetical protein